MLHAFTGKGDGEYPYTAVTLDHLGNLYGTTGSGGAFQRGTVFEISAQGKENILYSFWGGEGDQPSGPTISDEKGAFYSSTSEGGTPEGGRCLYGCGTVFKLDKSHKESVLYAFSGGADGSDPWGDLVRDEAGSLYGITEEGGDSSNCGHTRGCGLVFKLDRKGKETVLHTFTGFSDGSGASAGLMRDKTGNLYGVAYGGAYNAGLVFELNAAGQFTVLYTFTGGADGGGPSGPLIRDAAGNLYGVAGSGGDLSCHIGSSQGCGVVFKLDPTGKESVLYAFKGMPDGAAPSGGLVRDKAGSFYGNTSLGGLTAPVCTQLYGNQGCGTIFKVDTSSNETVLHRFTSRNGGDNPVAGPTIDGSGNLYGTTPYGGDSSCGQGVGCGVLFKLTP